MTKKIFIAATKQNDGKTTVALGLILNLKGTFNEIGFIKPIGQRYLEEEGFKVDEDSILIERVCETHGIKKGNLKDMSPIAVEKGFTERYIENPVQEIITNKIKESFKHIAKDKDLVIIEGTGHAGVGSVFDHSNAMVAKLLDAKVILISSGGIGRPIDEIILNKALFDKLGVDLLGVIVNKVMPEKFDKVNRIVRQGLKRKKIEVLGVIPYIPLLSSPTIGQILEETDFKLLSSSAGLNNLVESIIVGAMEPHNALDYIKDKSLIITPGDREDMILTALGCHLTKIKGHIQISGIILSGGIMPHPAIIDLIKENDIPTLISKKDTYHTANIIHDLIVKVRPGDSDKIEEIVGLIKNNVDIERIAKEI